MSNSNLVSGLDAPSTTQTPATAQLPLELHLQLFYSHVFFIVFSDVVWAKSGL